MTGKLRRRIENSQWPIRILAAFLAGYVKICWLSGRWAGEGDAELNRALEFGPVTFISWHGRILMGPPVWQRRGRISLPRDPSPAGRLSATTQRHFGMEAFEIGGSGGNFGIVRRVLRLTREGVSLGLTADGPTGPDRRAKQAALDWARATGRPVILFAWSSRRALRLPTWDRMLLPLPLAGGAFVFRTWDGPIATQLDTAAPADALADLGAALDRVTQRADELAGRNEKAPPEGGAQDRGMSRL